MKTGFVILNFNCWQKTTILAQKASSFDEVDAVVVIDNVSTDDSYEHLKEINHGKIYVQQSPKNGGYSYGNNFGAKVCKQLGMELVFISNPDVTIEEDDLRKIKTQFANKDYSILSGVEYDTNNQPVQPPLCKRREYWDDFFDCFFTARKLNGGRYDVPLDKTIEVQDAAMVKGSFFAVRLEDFLKAGCFDENVFLYCEERILSRKINQLGKKIGIVTSAKYFHTHSASITHSYRRLYRQIQILYDSRLYYNRMYNQISNIKYILLLAAMKFSVFEYYIWDMIREHSRRR